MEIHRHTESLQNLHPVACMGMFDGVHLGHRHLIDRLVQIAEERNKPSLLITFWPHPRLVLNPNDQSLRYLNTLEEKVQILADTGIDHLLIIPFTVEFANQTACEFIDKFLVHQIQIDFLLVGFNHHFGKDRMGSIVDLKLCAKSQNFGIEKQKAIKKEGKELSSSLIRELLHQGDVSEAKDYLSYPYFIAGKVVSGNKIGRTIGFPTANIELKDSHKLLPKVGVYAVYVTFENEKFFGMLNIGFRPTIDETNRQKFIEVHLFNFNQDIYNHKVQVHFIRKIRDEQKFNSLEELQNQLQKDKIETLKVFNL